MLEQNDNFIIQLDGDAHALVTPLKAPGIVKGQPVETIDNPAQQNIIANWGGPGNNSFPDDVIADVESTVELSSGINFYTSSLVGSGICYGYVEVDENGNDKLKRVIDPEIEAFFRENHIVNYYTSVAYNFKMFWNVFIEMVLSPDRKKIIAIKCHQSNDCRVSKQNATTGLVDTCYLNSNWATETASSPRTIPIPLVQLNFRPAEGLRLRNDSLRYIYKLSGPGNKRYYNLAPWNSVRQSSWIDVVNAIPVFKKAIMDNQMLIRYHVQIPDYYWRDKYPQWDSIKEEDRSKLRNTTFDEIKKFLTGSQNAGKNLFTTFKWDQHIQKELPGVKITPIQNQSFSGEYIEDSAEGAQKIYHALQIDSSLLGTLPGKGMSPGSGSDKSVAWNLHMARIRPEADLQNTPMEFVFEYNGWNKKYEQYGGLKCWFKNDFMARLMDVSPANRNPENV